MNARLIKTKEASERLGVSQTTVKRWASQYPSSFPKDRLGHYVFSEREISLLLYIKDEVDQGNALEQIVLPVPLSASEPRRSEVDLFELEEPEILSRIREVERSLTQKADEVVSAQVLQHRSELDELRQMVAQLAASVENLQGTSSKSDMPREEFRLPAPGQPLGQASSPARKRGFFKSFF
ncbi:MerR family transcriptional regulator [Cohnella lupini]|uniref:Chromosome-anchoring protein RacA n=1 Tax=Cohnella lupini TaxID=1294267 RepID=A0A3D9IA96_9BACL|nr:MerR family transcriptional regulator [Cohnella lupini]RED58116.1 chromosome-anchoring protein RacA [Cohnella lupini]